MPVCKGVLCIPFCSCICFTTREHNLYYIGNFIHTYAEAYLEPNQTSTMEIFRENSQRLKTVDCFCKKVPSQMLDWVLKTLLMWMYLIIFRRVFSACIYLNISCVMCFCVFVFFICQIILQLKLLTFIVLQYKGKFADAFLYFWGDT